MGSIEGAVIGALDVGICRRRVVHLEPQVELFAVYARDGAGAVRAP